MRASSLPNLGERLPAVDIIRYFSFLAILIFHMSFALWAPLGLNYVPLQNMAGQAIEAYARVLSFSGFTVLFLSFFLFGFRGSENRKFAKLPLYVLGFATAWTATVEEFPYWWDIYPFLLGVLVLFYFTKKIPAPILATISLTVVSIPFWKLETLIALPTWAMTAVIGVCSTRGDLGDWPLLPWAAYPIFAFAIGALVKKHRADLASMSTAEGAAWGFTLCLSTVYLGKYYVTPLGEAFGCFMFRQDPLTFWAHQLPVFLALRISLLESVARRLQKSRVATWFSVRPVNRYFFLIYFLHYPLAFAVAAFAEKFEMTMRPYVFTLSCAILFIAMESAPVVIDKLLPHNIWKEWIHGKGSTKDSQLSEGLGS